MSVASNLSAEYLAQSDQNEATVATLVLVIVAGLCVCMRIYTRARLIKHVGASDAAICLAWIVSAFLTASFWLECHWGMGKHVEAVPPQNYEHILRLLWVSILLYNLSLAFAKISILLQYIHIFASSSARKICWGFLALVSLHAVVATILAIFGCTPVNFFWTKAGNGSCLNLVAILFFNASFNIVTDITLVVIPLWIVRSLRMPRKQKWYLTFIFLLGGFGCITSILRLHSLYVSSVSVDFTWVEADTAVWSSAETNVGIMCACLATLKPLVARVFPRSFLGSSSSETSASTELSDFSQRNTANSESSWEASRIMEKETSRITVSKDDLYHSFMKDIEKSSA